jgi:hypothetical protein
MRQVSRLVCVVTTFLAFCLSARLAQAATIAVFDTRAVFNAAIENPLTINFEGIVATNAAVNFPNPGLTTSGVNFFTSGTGPFGPGFVTVYGAGLAAMQSPVLNTGTGAILVWGPPNQPGTAFLNAALPPGTTAVGTDLWAQQPFITSVDVIVSASDGTTQTLTVNTLTRPTASFIGFTSDVPITSIAFRPPANQTGLILDNFSYGKASGSTPVSEPATAILVFTGLIGASAVFKKNRRKVLHNNS